MSNANIMSKVNELRLQKVRFVINNTLIFDQCKTLIILSALEIKETTALLMLEDNACEVVRCMFLLDYKEITKSR